jgi:2-methylcitrate dehydratase PrpD
VGADRDSVSGRIVEWAFGLDLADIPVEVRAAASQHILDGLGTAAAACRYQKGGAATTVALGFPAPSESVVIGAGARVPAPWAALANGARMHALDYDDTHANALVHPTAVVLPTVLAVGEACGSSGADVLVAYVAGVEVMIRLGAVVRNGFHSSGFHATSVCGVFAAALVASRLAGLDEQAAISAMGLAGSEAAGSLEFLSTGSETKVLHPGLAAMQGVLASRLAQAGADGPSTIIEGRYGLFRSYLKHDVGPGEVTGTLGADWQAPAVTVKLYPACQLSHASLDALTTLLGEIASPEIVDSITFKIPTDAVPVICEPISAKIKPRTAYDAKFSLAWCAALLICDRKMDLTSFDPDRLDRPDVLALARRVHYRPVDSQLASAASPGTVEVLLNDGRVLNATHLPQGGAAIEVAIKRKFNANIADEVRAQQLTQCVMGLEDEPELCSLSNALASEFDHGTEVAWA